MWYCVTGDGALVSQSLVIMNAKIANIVQNV